MFIVYRYELIGINFQIINLLFTSNYLINSELNIDASNLFITTDGRISVKKKTEEKNRNLFFSSVLEQSCKWRALISVALNRNISSIIDKCFYENEHR